MTNTEVAKAFYEAFKQKDGESMARCYASDAQFSDPVFPNLTGDRIGMMWKMLCKNGKDLKVSYVVEDGSGEAVTVNWDAWYTFSKTGRPVHNQIKAKLRIQNGKIVRHVDSFDFWKWSRQALGPIGLIAGWTPAIKNKVRKTAAMSLEKFSG